LKNNLSLGKQAIEKRFLSFAGTCPLGFTIAIVTVVIVNLALGRNIDAGYDAPPATKHNPDAWCAWPCCGRIGRYLHALCALVYRKGHPSA
jgi:hypothetical protein